MSKTAVLLAEGFEEIEALTVVDVLRRANLDCQMLGFTEQVTGAHGITVQADQVWDGELKGYDMVVLPGGMSGAANLRDDDRLMKLLLDFQAQEKYIAAICAAPIALDRAGLLKDRSFTCYDGTKKQITDGRYRKETVVVDGRLITSRGPSTALAFAYELVDQLGGDSSRLAEAMLYTDVFGN